MAELQTKSKRIFSEFSLFSQQIGKSAGFRMVFPLKSPKFCTVFSLKSSLSLSLSLVCSAKVTVKIPQNHKMKEKRNG